MGSKSRVWIPSTERWEVGLGAVETTSASYLLRPLLRTRRPWPASPSGLSALGSLGGGSG